MSMTAKTKRRVAFPIAFAIFATMLMTSVMMLSVAGLIHHWQTVALPCSECVDSFFLHTITPSHLLYGFGLLFSLVAALRGFFFLKKEYKFHKPIISAAAESVFLVDDAPLPAWSSGFMHPKIYCDSRFWHALSVEEREALLAHERTHIAEGDIPMQFALGWIRALLPFPYLHAALSRYIAAVHQRAELYADEHAIACSSAQTLAQVLKKTIGYKTLPYVPVTVSAVTGLLELRVSQLKGEQSGGMARSSLQASPVLMMGFFWLSALTAAIFLIEPVSSCFS